MKHNYFKNLRVPSLKGRRWSFAPVPTAHLLQESTIMLVRSENGFRDPEGPRFRTSDTVHNSEPLRLIHFSNSHTHSSQANPL